MQTSKEVSALLSLIDDPDDEIFETVSEKIIGYGSNILPSLETLWEISPDREIQQRIELIIHRLQLSELTEEFKQWVNSDQQDLLTGVLLVCKYENHSISKPSVTEVLEKMKRNIWLELNNYLTPLEELNIIVSILFNYYKIKTDSIYPKKINTYLLDKLLESKEGNQLSNGILILILAEMLDLPIKAIQNPDQFLLAYFKSDINLESNSSFQYELDFYLDPKCGTIFSKKNLISYLTRVSLLPKPPFLKPASNVEIIQRLMLALIVCYAEDKQEIKKKELRDLANLLG